MVSGARSSGPGGMWLLSSSGAEEVSPPLTCPVAFGMSRGFGGKMGATLWKRLLSSAKSLFARANLGDGTTSLVRCYSSYSTIR